MRTILAGITAVLQLLIVTVPQTLPGRLRSGELLRFHVVAQDDTEKMQQIKLRVRDAVHACYAAEHTGTGTMLEEAEELLPLLTQAAADAAKEEGFTGDVRVTLTASSFSARLLGRHIVPAGEYPALMVLLGDAQGRNWWGLLDPELSLEMSRIPEEEEENDEPVWDWSFWGLVRALFGIPTRGGKGG